MRASHRWLVNFSLKGPLKWKMFPFEDVIMLDQCGSKAAMSPNMSLLLCNGTCCRCRGFYSADQNVQKHKLATQQQNIICHSIRRSSMMSQITFLKMFSLLIIVSLICLAPLAVWLQVRRCYPINCLVASWQFCIDSIDVLGERGFSRRAVCEFNISQNSCC